MCTRDIQAYGIAPKPYQNLDKCVCDVEMLMTLRGDVREGGRGVEAEGRARVTLALQGQEDLSVFTLPAA